MELSDKLPNFALDLLVLPMRKAYGLVVAKFTLVLPPREKTLAMEVTEVPCKVVGQN